jgi:hypothetical protein
MNHTLRTHGRRRAAVGAVGAAVTAFALSAGTGQALAGKITVDSKKAEGEGTFAAAVKRANKQDGPDQIRFADNLRGKIDLPEELTMKGKLVVGGNGYGTPGTKAFSKLELSGHRGGTRLVVVSKANVSLRDLYLDGISTHSEEARLTISDSFLEGERTVDKNGVSSDDGELRVLRSTVQGFDGGVSMRRTETRIDRSTISGNSGGGGIYVGDRSDADISNSTIASNVITGIGNGGGISVSGYSAGARIVNSTITDNLTTGNNSLSGGVFGNVEVINSTITANRSAAGAGVAGSGEGDADVSNSIVYGNVTHGGTPADCADPFTSRGGNLIGEPGECLLDGSDRRNVDPLLGPLADNGGPTQTQAILPGSPAIDLAVPELAAKFDQRGVKRGDDPDAGAYERRG